MNGHDPVTDGEFAGTTAVVSGAGSGIGRHVAQTLAACGSTVALLDRDAKAVRAAAEECAAAGFSVLPVAVDVADSGAVDRAVAEVEDACGPIDHLVSAAGVLRLGDVATTTDEDWRHIFSVNVDGVFHLSRAVLRRMMPRRRGTIVTVASNAGRVPRAQMAAYGASKAATAHFAKSLALEAAAFGIRCNVVSPGSTDTPMLRSMWTDDSGPVHTVDGDPAAYRLGIPLRKLARPADITDAVLFLLSARSGHITMQDLCVDGGAVLGA
ncbi:2,3-dihydro-2,3-dihydroxybenzoate dehydrogenase [Actinacidiphila rubida]|uniref:2,3-dihydro-2,3-dihydroxybenzoate dehydrogenase n=1 Tax=Actinacidiphila rubida TaxID=310780 RepID=A0A1H8LLP1_9ACTN|nr:2,3-dihydro-2,3-dihydroxybenzoate dehydrogenase [Actinacidiphila rubida]SEO06027.1 2,3-dihydro-2,3-dihydroxybenzoate dehydrogenase [Actinacidiphila rubida]